MRNQILKAAVSCDYQLLQELALKPHGSFQYSLTEESAGPDAKPAEFWRTQERAGNQPLRALVEILNTNPKVQPVTEPEGPGTGSADVLQLAGQPVTGNLRRIPDQHHFHR